MDAEKARSDEQQLPPRKSAIFSVFSYSICACKSGEKKLIEAASNHIDEQLDIISFLRHQLVDRIERRNLFTRLERYLLKNQAKPFVLNASYSNKKKTPDSDSDSSDFEPIRLHEHMDDSPFYDQLFGGAVPYQDQTKSQSSDPDSIVKAKQDESSSSINSASAH